MASTTLTTDIRRRLYTFARRLASPFTDSRRRRFLTDMLTGLIVSGKVFLTAIARTLYKGTGNVHADEKRLSRNLASEHWDMSPVADQLLRCSAARVRDDTLLVADLTDLAKDYARKLEGLGTVPDGSDRDKRLTHGYMVLETYVRVGRWQLFPLTADLLTTYAGAPTGENAEILGHLLRCHEAVGRRGTWLLDRGFDRRELLGPLVRHGVALVVRQLGTRNVTTACGRTLTVDELVAEQTCPRPRRWPRGGTAVAVEVTLPEVSAEPFLLVVGWRVPNSQRRLVLLVSPAARRPGRTARWYARAYLRRWGVEDAIRGIKQHFDLESFLVRSWRSISRLLVLVAWAFWWLNLWGEPGYARLCAAILNHSWRLRKEVIYRFDWIASFLRELLHPKPRLVSDTG